MNDMQKTPIDLTTAEKLYAIHLWQTCRYIHPLTCGNDSNHRELIPWLLGREQIILKCVDCEYTQAYIPDSVYGIYQAAKESSVEHIYHQIALPAEQPEGNVIGEDCRRRKCTT